jgi:hypothetical protein
MRQCGRCETGVVSEQTITIQDENGQVFSWRKITLNLDQPTRDGETTIVLISNLPRRVKPATIATAYRERWTIEQHFQRLTDWLHCEVSTLGYPRAALFALKPRRTPNCKNIKYLSTHRLLNQTHGKAC